MKLETVTIDTDSGPVVINKCDFDDKIHKVHDSMPKKASDISAQLRLWGVIFDTNAKIAQLRKLYKEEEKKH